MDLKSAYSARSHSYDSYRRQAPYSHMEYPLSQGEPQLWNAPPPPSVHAHNWNGMNYWAPPLINTPTEQSNSPYDTNSEDVASTSSSSLLTSEMLAAQTVTNAIANRYYTSNSNSYGFREQILQQRPFSSRLYGRNYNERNSAISSRNQIGEDEIERNEKKTRREEDQQLVDSFMAKVVKAPSSTKSGNGVSIGNARIQMKKCITLINELKAIHSKLNEESIKSDDSLWDATAREAIDAKKKLRSLLGELNSKEKIADLEKKMKKIRKKRERLKRQKLLKSEEKKEKEKQNKLQHEKLDFWLHSIRVDYLNTQMEKKMKKEADGILSEVRRKKAEANRVMDLVKTFSKLRAVRKQTAEAKGLFSSTEADEKFSKSICRLETILQCRLSEYGEEERTLQVMLEEEHQETRDMETKRQQQVRDDKENTARDEVLRSLFGSEVVVSEHDPRFCCWEYLTRSERDLDALIHVRNEWDSWLVLNDGTHNCSSVPIGWIRPTDPWNEGWASMLS